MDVVIALVTAGMGALLLHRMRQPARALDTVFDSDAEVVLHVAGHEARTRGEIPSSLHVLYGLLQDEATVTAIREVGGDPDALEDQVLAALDARLRSDDVRDDDDIQRVTGYAAGHAHNVGRRASSRDLWAYLRFSDAAALLEAMPASLAAVLFRLCHGSAEPALDAIGTADVHVVLRNDDYTTQEFVCEILRELFGLAAEQANLHMLETHTQGRSVVARLRPEDARNRIEEVRRRAHAAGFPLWIGIEPT